MFSIKIWGGHVEHITPAMNSQTCLLVNRRAVIYRAVVLFLVTSHLVTSHTNTVIASQIVGVVMSLKTTIRGFPLCPHHRGACPRWFRGFISCSHRYGAQYAMFTLLMIRTGYRNVRCESSDGDIHSIVHRTQVCLIVMFDNGRRSSPTLH